VRGGGAQGGGVGELEREGGMEKEGGGQASCLNGSGGIMIGV
jgi:hypothetical protein